MIKDSELISIVVPVYNVENYIDRCISSLINQDYKNIEILLIDDGSNDSSGMICDSYAKKDERIKVVHGKNEGVSTYFICLHINTSLDSVLGDSTLI